MNRYLAAAIAAFALISCSSEVLVEQTRQEVLLEEGWKFTREDGDFAPVAFDDSQWQDVTVPHDWAIYGPFDSNNDAQVVAITQNFETRASLKTGRTGGLPYVGTGWYRLEFDVPDFSEGKKAELLFDGAMSYSKVYVNGNYVGEWPYGYNSFHFDVTEYINKDGKDNLLAVRLENLPQSSRWYPGAGLYRNVHLIVTDDVHIPVWGTQIICSEISEKSANVNLKIKVNGKADMVKTDIVSPSGKVVATISDSKAWAEGVEQNVVVKKPALWSPESPSLYKAVSSVYVGEEKVDEYTTVFGIRSIELIANKGFFLNGKVRKFQGVCNHHDLGPLGAAINEAAEDRDHDEVF